MPCKCLIGVQYRVKIQAKQIVLVLDVALYIIDTIPGMSECTSMYM